MESSTGRPVVNQFIIIEGMCHYFQSYNTVIAKIHATNSVTLIKNACNISKTTSKYLYKFLDKFSSVDKQYLNKAGIEKLIKQGDIKEVDKLELYISSCGLGFHQRFKHKPL